MTPFARILRFVRPYTRRLVFSVFLTLALTIIGLMMPLIIKVIVDDCILMDNWDLFPVMIVLGLAIPLVRGLMAFINRLNLVAVGQRVVLDIRMGMYRRIQSLSLDYFNRTPAGGIMERLMSDTNAIVTMVTGNTITLAQDIVMCVFGLVVMAMLSWRLTLLSIVVVPLYLLNYKLFIKHIRETSRKYRLKMDEVTGVLSERIDGSMTVKLYNKEEAESNLFVQETGRGYELAVRARKFSLGFSQMSQSLAGLNWIVTYCLGAALVISETMTYGSVLAFCTYASQLLGPAIRFSAMINQFQETLVSMERISEVLATEPTITDAPDAVDAPHGGGQIDFEEVCFEYLKGKPVLHNINLHIPAGQTVAFVGATGCGKTTLATLLFRFYDPVFGSIKLDGVDLRKIRVRDLRGEIGIVLQDSIMFNDTIFNNIAYGKPRATEDEVVAAARLAEIHKVIVGFPDGYQTKIGKDAMKLTGGQMQRLAIARAVLCDPKILILDEATSSLDTESERLIQKALDKTMEGRTTIVIAHRLSTIENADKIVVIDKGRIMEEGSHDELLQIEGGHYRNLYDKQFAEEEQAMEASDDTSISTFDEDDET
ncbi:MAG: ABC transporter ATP-binding protein [Planctomycetota bacterium]